MAISLHTTLHTLNTNLLRLPTDSDTEQPVRAVSIESLMPGDTSKYYRYNGSLTTPGCYESVIWTVFREKLPISYDQVPTQTYTMHAA